MRMVCGRARCLAALLFLFATAAANAADACVPPSREHLARIAVSDPGTLAPGGHTLLLTVVDGALWGFFGESWVQEVRRAGVKYWLVVASDDAAASGVAAAGYGAQCVLLPGATEAGGGPTSAPYVWNSAAWRRATWAKVTAVAAIVDLGFNVVHSDVDVTWFADPLPGLSLLTRKTAAAAAAAAAADSAAAVAGSGGSGGAAAAATVLLSTDMLTTRNPPHMAGSSGGGGGGDGDGGGGGTGVTAGPELSLEAACGPHIDLNTGVYWVRAGPEGSRLLHAWLAIRSAGYEGHDQQALNLLARGFLPYAFGRLPHGYAPLPRNATPAARAAAEAAGTSGVPRMLQRSGAGAGGRAGAGALPLYAAAGAPGVAGGGVAGVVVGCLPVSSFSHTYAYATTRLHEVLRHPLTEVHWVWGGRSLEAKRQAMRDACVFHDAPAYYSPAALMTFDLPHEQLPDGYNDWPEARTEEMVSFALAAAARQLQAAYWAMALALVLNRTLVMPRFRCYCARNWYKTTACRIGAERHTRFPFTCPLSHMLRVKLLTNGELRIRDPLLPEGTHDGGGSGAGAGGGGSSGGWRVLDVREHSFLGNPRTSAELRNAPRTTLLLRPLPHGAAAAAGTGAGEQRELVLHAPLTDRQLQALLGRGAPPSSLASASATASTSASLSLTYAAAAAARVLHVPDPAAVLSGFEDSGLWDAYDAAVLRLAATWCCRSAAAAAAVRGRRRERLQVLPPSREQRRQGTGASAAA